MTGLAYLNITVFLTLGKGIRERWGSTVSGGWHGKLFVWPSLLT